MCVCVLARMREGAEGALGGSEGVHAPVAARAAVARDLAGAVAAPEFGGAVVGARAQDVSHRVECQAPHGSLMRASRLRLRLLVAHQPGRGPPHRQQADANPD